MNTAQKIGLGAILLATGIAVYLNVKPKVNKSKVLTLGYDTSKINPNFKTVLGI